MGVKCGRLTRVILGGEKRILGCSSKTFSKAVREDMCLETLHGCRDKAKLKLWPEDRYPRRVFTQVWDARGRQREVWSRLSIRGI